MNDLSVLRAAFIKNSITQNMEIEIPLACPKCQGRLYSVSYETSFNILKKRSWQVCKDCNYERNTDDFKKSICCA
jgi:C4-type Zn-finger protein